MAATQTSSVKTDPKGGQGHELFADKFHELLAMVRANRPSDDVEIIRKAWHFCLEHHKGQLRASGEPYVLHPLEVAMVLAEMKLDSTAIAAGLLHDAVEDTPVTTADITAMFGEQVAHIVEGVTKIDKIQFANREDRQAENVRKMLLAMVSDVRVVLIKLADRLHNMRTLEHLAADRQQAISRETLDIYAPLAHRLGMGKVRGELEDLAFRYVDPFTYEQVHEAVEARRTEGEQFLAGVEALLKEKLAENHIKARVQWRIKRLYSINQKILKSKISVDQVYDLLALRVITSSVQDCYAVFGLIHSIWRPVPGRIKDFIAMPRPNLYQSLHTTVMGEGGHQFEVQIRTDEMHRIAEEGIAAHWKYKDSGSPISARDEQRLAWVRQLVEWQRDMTDPRNGNAAGVSDSSTASPVIGPDNDVYFGVLESNFPARSSRGWLLHFDSTLTIIKTPGSFGWDDTPSIVPANLVASYTGTSSYLILSKYNNYADFGLEDGKNKMAILDPNKTQTDPIESYPVMSEVMTVIGQTSDADNFPTIPGAVKEWCVNSAAVDPITKSIFMNSEDGFLYRWDLTSGQLSQKIWLDSGYGQAYTPTALGPDGTVYSINAANLIAVRSK